MHHLFVYIYDTARFGFGFRFRLDIIRYYMF